MKTLHLLALLTTAFFVTSSGAEPDKPAPTEAKEPMPANSFHEIAQQAHAKYAAAQEIWQRDLAEQTAKANPEFRELATVQRDLQLANIEQKKARFPYLLEHDPSRIVLTGGISKFANFEWTERDTQSLASTSPTYSQLQKKIEALEKQNGIQPDWPKFRTWFRETFSKSDEYKKLLDDFKAEQKEVEDLLGKYKPAQPASPADSGGKTSPKALLDLISQKPQDIKAVLLATSASTVEMKDGRKFFSDSHDLQKDLADAAKNAGIPFSWE